MAFPFLSLFLALSLSSSLLISPANSQICLSQNLSTNNLYTHCLDLPQHTAYLHWTYDSLNSSMSVAFTAPPAKSDGWISWAINPSNTGMVGAQSLIAFKESTGVMTVKTFNLISYKSIKEAKLSFEVWDTSAVYEDGVMRIFVKVKVPEKAMMINQVWQVGSSVNNGVPAIHAFQSANLNSKGTLNLMGGTTTTGSSPTGDSRIKKRNIHGILNAVSWGILFPVGVIMARYLRTFKSADPAWFYLHVFCQVSGYAIGVAGWATGLKLGSKSKGIQFTAHRNIGIALFSLATLQIFALFLRPKPDHKYRLYWNIYHHSVGYIIVILGIFNVFKGLDILNPVKKWKSNYIIVISVLGAIALLLEAITWIVAYRKKSKKSTNPYDGYNNGQGGQQPLPI